MEIRSKKEKGFIQHHLYKKGKSDAGFTVLFAVLIASLVLTIGLSVFNISLKEFILSSQIRDSQAAFYAADAALECATYWDRNPAAPYNASIFGGGRNVDTLSQGLIGYWRFNDDSNHPIALDSASPDNDGTLENMEAGDWDPDGRVGGALDFGGTDERVNIDGLIGELDTSKGTFSAWVKFADSLHLNDSSARGLVEVGSTEAACGDGSCPDGNFIGFRKTTGNQVVFRYTANGVLISSTITNPDIQDMDTWTHLVGTWDTDGSVSIYKNGVLENSVTRVGGDISISGLDHGRVASRADSGGVGLYFVGHIDEVRVYERALNPDEIAALALLSGTDAFVNPIAEGTGQNTNCAGQNITHIDSGWDNDLSQTLGRDWSQVITPGESATTSFDLIFDEGYCATVTVGKTVDGGNIEARGYNTCELGSPRRVERALRLQY